jgi:hypothetical protein
MADGVQSGFSDGVDGWQQDIIKTCMRVRLSA